MSDKIIQLNEGVIKQELGEMVRLSVEETLNVCRSPLSRHDFENVSYSFHNL